MMVCYGLKLKCVLLCVICREDLIEYDQSAVTISRGKNQALPVWRPLNWKGSVHAKDTSRQNKKAYQVKSVNSS